METRVTEQKVDGMTFKKVYRFFWCAWCCERFKSEKEKCFCSKSCTWVWQRAKATSPERKLEQSEVEVSVLRS